MSAIGNIVLNDGQATPVSHTFKPQSATSDLASWTDRSNGISIGMPTLSLSVKGGGADTSRVKGKVVVPILEVQSNSSLSGFEPAPQIAYQCIGTFELVMPARSTLDARKDLLAFVKNFLSDASVTVAVEEFERPY